jgi:hypothetical protein
MEDVNEVQDGCTNYSSCSTRCARDIPNHREANHRTKCEVSDEGGWKRRTVFNYIAENLNLKTELHNAKPPDVKWLSW